MLLIKQTQSWPQITTIRTHSLRAVTTRNGGNLSQKEMYCMLDITVNKNSLKLPVIVAKVVLTQEAHNKSTLSLSDRVCFNDL